MGRVGKRLRIGGVEFKVKASTDGGGRFSFDTGEMFLPGSNNPNHIVVLFHEVAEAILIDLHTRYATYDEQDGMAFIMDHGKFAAFIEFLVGAMLENDIISRAGVRRLVD